MVFWFGVGFLTGVGTCCLALLLVSRKEAHQSMMISSDAAWKPRGAMTPMEKAEAIRALGIEQYMDLPA